MGEGFLQGKKVLFFSWPFYQYPDKICEALQHSGADVTYYCSAPTTNFLKIKFMERYEFLKKAYFNDILDEISKTHFDYLFMINAAVFPKDFLEKLSVLCGDAKRILYSWDSLSVYPKASDLFGYFDEVYSFDSFDVENYPTLKFLPLFYIDEFFSEQKVEKKYDFSFIGFGHSERYEFIRQIQKFANTNEYSYFFRLYLPSKIHFYRGKYIRKNLKFSHEDDFFYTSTPHETVKEITNQSKIIVDLELSNQSGLTMRTIETHGMRKKLITTNPHVKGYDFYNENNILVVDRKNPVIPKEFVETEYQKLPGDVYKEYTLSHWIRIIFGDIINEN